MNVARIVVLSVAVAAAGCRPRPSPVEAVRSTLAGVYSTDQASRGEAVYDASCRNCHSGLVHSATFKIRWSGRVLADLQRYVSKKMPGDEPGTLSREEYTDVVAYLLQLAGVPAGPEALPGDDVALRMIRFDTLAAAQQRDR